MKGRLVCLGEIAGREVAALFEEGQLSDLLVEADATAPGTIYRARADRPVKGQGGMFLTGPDGACFLRQVKGLAPGQHLMVQVTGYAEPGKAIPVTAKLLFKSRYAIVTPEAPGINVSRAIKEDEERDRLLEIAHEAMAAAGAAQMGLILRSAAQGAEAEEIAADIEAMAQLGTVITGDEGDSIETLLDGDGPHALAWRDWPKPDVIEESAEGFAAHGVEEAIAALRLPEASLPGGAMAYIEPTRALIAVDINTGGDMSPAAGLKANLAAAKDLPRQLRLRGLGGQITLDLAPMGKKDRRQFETTLRAAFRRDTTETALVGWTPLGHFELQRKRDRLPLADLFGGEANS